MFGLLETKYCHLKDSVTVRLSKSEIKLLLDIEQVLLWYQFFLTDKMIIDLITLIHAHMFVHITFKMTVLYVFTKRQKPSYPHLHCRHNRLKKKKRKGWTLWIEEEAGDIKRIKVKMKINSWKQTKAWENAKSFQG